VTRPPLISLAGAAVIGAGLVFDLVVHLALPAVPHEHHAHAGFSLSEHAAHLVVMVGMALTLAGVVIDGARRQIQRRELPASTQRSQSHAHR
jgi:hypothetical protein